LLRGSGAVPEAIRRCPANPPPFSPNTARDHDIRGGPILGKPDSGIKPLLGRGGVGQTAV
jgi:hypothetical protein